MVIELIMLVWLIVLGFVYIFVIFIVVICECGMKWNVLVWDGDVKLFSVLVGCLQCVQVNFLEIFLFFVVVVIVVVVVGCSNDIMVLVVQVYFWVCVVYLLLYVVGVFYVCSLVWFVLLLLILVLVFVLLQLGLIQIKVSYVCGVMLVWIELMVGGVYVQDGCGGGWCWIGGFVFCVCVGWQWFVGWVG